MLPMLSLKTSARVCSWLPLDDRHSRDLDCVRDCWSVRVPTPVSKDVPERELFQPPGPTGTSNTAAFFRQVDDEDLLEFLRFATLVKGKTAAGVPQYLYFATLIAWQMTCGTGTLACAETSF